MTTPNNNYVTGVERLGAANRAYTAAASGPFNLAGDFCAFVLFWVFGRYQSQTAAVAKAMELWGNFDSVGSTGWGLRIVPDAGDAEIPVLQAIVGDGVGTCENNLPLARITPGEGSSYIERLIMAGLWYDSVNQNVRLSVNGSLQAGTPALANPYAPSAVPPSLGMGAAGDADDVAFVACGYGRPGFPNILDTDSGAFAGSSFYSARASNSGGFLEPDLGTDWIHRYELTSAVSGVGGGVIQKNAAGPTIVTRVPAPDALLDVGGTGFANLELPSLTPNPVNLLAVDGQSPEISRIAIRRNPDWYHGGAFRFFTK